MDSLLDDVQGSLLVAHEGGGNATHNLLSPTWVEVRSLARVANKADKSSRVRLGGLTSLRMLSDPKC